LPPLEHQRAEKGTAPVFGPAETCEGSPLEEVGRGYYKKLLAINEGEETRQSGGSVQIREGYGERYDENRQAEGSNHAKYAVFEWR